VFTFCELGVPLVLYGTDTASPKKNENVIEIQTEGITFLRNVKEFTRLQKLTIKIKVMGLNIYF
jgi:hypothetical protein